MGSPNNILLILISSLLSLVISESANDQLPCGFMDSINITEGTLNHTDGSILHNDLLYKPHNYALINYTEDSNGPNPVQNPYFRGCICQVTNCVWLCCEDFEDLDGISSCTNPVNRTELFVEVVDELGKFYELDLIKNSSLHRALRYATNMIGFEKGEWSMNSKGYVQSHIDDFSLSQESYCLMESYVVYDIAEVPFDNRAIAIMISIPFMLVTLFIYLCIPELRNIHGKCLICHVFSMTCCFSIMLYQKCIESGLVDGWSSCYYFLYFWSMAGFFWLNVICFDIFWTFSSGVVKKSERKRFLYYSLYAWGTPLVLVGLLTAIECTSFVPEEFRPNIRSELNICALGGERWLQLIYWYSVVLLLLVVNIFFFILTATRIIGIQRATDAVMQQGSKRHSSIENRYRIHLYLRLFVVMGVSWIFEVISYLVCPDQSCEHFTDLLNCLSGVFIFMMFVCKTNVKNMILKRIGMRRPLNRSKSSYTISTSINFTKEATVPLRQLSRMESCPEKFSDEKYY